MNMYLQVWGISWQVADNSAIATMQLIEQGKIQNFLYNEIFRFAPLTLFSADLFEAMIDENDAKACLI